MENQPVNAENHYPTPRRLHTLRAQIPLSDMEREQKAESMRRRLASNPLAHRKSAPIIGTAMEAITKSQLKVCPQKQSQMVPNVPLENCGLLPLEEKVRVSWREEALLRSRVHQEPFTRQEVLDAKQLLLFTSAHCCY